MSEENTKYVAVRNPSTGTVDYVREYNGPNGSKDDKQSPSKYMAVRNPSTGTVDYVPVFDAPYKPATKEEKSLGLLIFLFFAQLAGYILPIGFISIIVGQSMRNGKESTPGSIFWTAYGVFGLICTFFIWFLLLTGLGDSFIQMVDSYSAFH